LLFDIAMFYSKHMKSFLLELSGKQTFLFALHELYWNGNNKATASVV